MSIRSGAAIAAATIGRRHHVPVSVSIMPMPRRQGSIRRLLRLDGGRLGLVGQRRGMQGRGTWDEVVRELWRRHCCDTPTHIGIDIRVCVGIGSLGRVRVEIRLQRRLLLLLLRLGLLRRSLLMGLLDGKDLLHLADLVRGQSSGSMGLLLRLRCLSRRRYIIGCPSAGSSTASASTSTGTTACHGGWDHMERTHAHSVCLTR